MRYILFAFLLLISTNIALAQTEDFVEASIDIESPYVGQPIVYSIRVFTTRDIQDTAVIEPRFNGFGRSPFVSDANVSSEARDGAVYTVIEHSLLLYPLRAGEQTIDPLRIEIPETPFDAPTSVQTDTIPVRVQPLPDDAPRSFKNAVGQFNIEAAVDQTSGAAGDAITLSVVVNGAGNIEQIIAPDILIPNTWRSFPQSPITERDTLRFGTKTFTWILLPDAEGDAEIPSVEFSFFNPQTLTYETRLTAPIPVTVTAGITSAAQQAAQITRYEEVRDISELRVSNQSPLPPLTPPLFWLLWLPLPVIALILWLPRRARLRPRRVRRRRQRRNTNSNALIRSRDQLKAAQTLEPRAAYAHIQKTIYDYLSTKTGQQITEDEVKATIGHLPPKLQGLLLQCIEEAASGQYAPVSKEDVAILLRQTMKILNAVEKAWQP